MLCRLALLGVCALLTAPVFAASIELEEPGGGGGGGPLTRPAMSLPFSFEGVSGGGCLVGSVLVPWCEFRNETGVDLDAISITVFSTESASCGALYGFSSCQVLQFGAGSLPSILLFSDGEGWDDGQALRFSVSGWESGTQFTVGTVPEPSVFWPALLALAGLGVRRRYARTTRRAVG